MITLDITLGAGRRLWLTSDTHFGHANIIKYCARPFASVEEMDVALCLGWNDCVAEDDVVIHLGDFAYKSRGRVADIAGCLKGRKYILCGNHDRYEDLMASGAFLEVVWHRIGVLKESPVAVDLVVNDVRCAVLSHYPQVVWVGKDALIPHFYGHRHTGAVKPRRERDSGSLDVGVDNCGYRPIEFWEAVKNVGD